MTDPGPGQALASGATVVDAHLHLWDASSSDYAWLASAPQTLQRTFRWTDAEREMDGCGVQRAVLVQASNSAADTDAMLAVADVTPRVAGVVGWVPLTDPEATAVALASYAQDPRVVGVRHLIHEEPNPHWLGQDTVQQSLALVADHGMAFDVVAVLPQHLELVGDIAESNPALRLVLDHLGRPPVAAGGWQPWATLIARAAQHPGVTAKLSGLGPAADPHHWSAEDLRPYVEHALQVFGPERVMYGGDYPVSLIAGGYRRTWDATSDLLAGLSSADRALVLSGTATHVYRLDDITTADGTQTLRTDRRS